MVVAVMGVFAGLVFEGSTRVLVWIVSGLLAVWLVVANALLQMRYQKIVSRIEHDIDLADRSQPESEPSEPKLPPATGGALESLRSRARRRAERYCANAALVCIGISIAGIVVGFNFSGAIRFNVIFTSFFGGVLLTWMCLLTRTRIRKSR